MSKKSVRLRRVSLETQELAKRVAEWAGSPEEMAAIERSIKAGKETAQVYKDAQRRGAERIGDLVRMFGIEPENSSPAYFFVIPSSEILNSTVPSRSVRYCCMFAFCNRSRVPA